MKCVRLRISSQDNVELLADLKWEDGKLEVISSEPDFRSAIDRWVAHGLREWVGPPTEAWPRMTAVTHPEFLERVRDYVQRQFAFVTDLRVTDTDEMLLIADTLSVEAFEATSESRVVWVGTQEAA